MTALLMPEHDIHLATSTEMNMVADILGSAFVDDPILEWLCGEPAIYSSLFLLEIDTLYKQHRHIYLNKDKTGAAIWLPPGVAVKPALHWRLFPTAFQLIRESGLKSLQRSSQFVQLMAQWHIQEPHFYLHAVGASLGNQGRGLGSALLKAGLKACDEAAIPAYLESTNEKNNPLYERFGFEVIGEQRLPDGGPMIWFMQRPKR